MLNTYWLGKKRGERPWLLCHGAPRSPFLGSQLSGVACSLPQPALAASRGRGRKKGGGEACSHPGKIAPGVGDDCTPHPQGRRTAERGTEKASTPLRRIHYSELPPTPGAAMGVWEKHQPRPLVPPLPGVWAANPGQRPEAESEPRLEPWLSRGPGDVMGAAGMSPERGLPTELALKLHCA